MRNFSFNQKIEIMEALQDLPDEEKRLKLKEICDNLESNSSKMLLGMGISMLGGVIIDHLIGDANELNKWMQNSWIHKPIEIKNEWFPGIPKTDFELKAARYANFLKQIGELPQIAKELFPAVVISSFSMKKFFILRKYRKKIGR